MAKIITVFGGVGAQGGSVVQALLKRGNKYKIRVATRDVNSEKAKALAKQGVDIVNASYDDYPSLVAALKGAHGAWFITSFWEVKDPAKEIAQGANVAKAAKETGLQHLVFSTLGSTREFGIDLPPFEDKVDIEHVIRQSGVPHSFVNVTLYLNNFLTFGKPQKYDPNGPYVIAFPVGAHGITVIDNADVGECFAKVFDDREAYLGKKIGIAAETVKSAQQVVDTFNEVFAPAKFASGGDLEAFRKATESMGPTFYNMYNYYNKSHNTHFDVELTHKLNPNAKTLKQFLIANKDKFSF